MKISVIVCTYNYAHLLKDALRSLSAQTLPDFELLIVDDGSTDHTEELVRQYSSKFRNCIYLRKPHAGLGDSRNYGIRKATGTHIAFLDADDLCSPEYLEAMHDVFQRIPEADLVCCNGLRIDNSGFVLGPLIPSNLPPVCGPLRTVREFLSFYSYFSIAFSMYKKSFHERVGSFDTGYPLGTDDMDWFARAIRKEPFCVRLDRKLVLYRHHGGNTTSRHPAEMLEAWVLAQGNLWTEPWFDSEFKASFRKLARRRFPPLLARYSPEQNRKLLRHTMEHFGNDWLLKVVVFLTYFGLCRVVKWGWGAKQILRKLSPRKMRIDLQAPPEIMFAAVSGESLRRELVNP